MHYKREKWRYQSLLFWNLFYFLIQAGDLFQDSWNILVLNLVFGIKSGSWQCHGRNNSVINKGFHLGSEEIEYTCSLYIFLVIFFPYIILSCHFLFSVTLILTAVVTADSFASYVSSLTGTSGFLQCHC